MIHQIKILSSFAKAILDGEKTFEIRENDRGYQKGDILQFTPFDNFGVRDWGIDVFEAEITYVLSGWGLKNGYVALGIKVIRDTYEVGIEK